MHLRYMRQIVCRQKGTHCPQKYAFEFVFSTQNINYNICEFVVEDDEATHYKCDLCAATFRNPRPLREHMNQHTGEKLTKRFSFCIQLIKILQETTHTNAIHVVVVLTSSVC